MFILYPKELTLSHWKTKKSRLVTATDLEQLLTDLERQYKKIDQSKLRASGYPQLVDIRAVKEAASKAAQIHNRTVPQLDKLLQQTQLVAKSTAERLVRARTVPKADINLVRGIEKACDQQRKAWLDPAQNGKLSFAKCQEALEKEIAPLRRKVEQELANLLGAMRATKSYPTVPYWLLGRDPRIGAKTINDKCIESICKRIIRLLSSNAAFAAAAREFAKFADEYPKKQKRIRMADPRLKAGDPQKYEQHFHAEQAALTLCLSELARAIYQLKQSLSDR